MQAGERHARQSVIEACLRMARDGLVTGTAGNVSVRLGDRMLITPGSRDYETLTVEDIRDVGALAADGDDPGASSETPLHRAIYAATSAQAIVHYHGIHSVAVSNTLDRLPVEHYYALRLGGEVRVAPYARFGSPELATNVADAISDRRAALMQNHGGVGIGHSLDRAYAHAALLEWLCQLTILSRVVGTPRVLTDAEAADVGF